MKQHSGGSVQNTAQDKASFLLEPRCRTEGRSLNHAGIMQICSQPPSELDPSEI